MNTAIRSCWLAILLGCLAAGACNGPGPETAVTGGDSTVEQEPGPTDCITHTTLAQLPAPNQDELVAAVRNLMQQVDSVAARQQQDLGQLGIEADLVGRQVVGQDTMLVWRSPQYHDCQDLIEVGRSDSLIYTARAGVLATIEAQVIQDTDFQAANTVGIRVAFVQRLAGADYANLRLDRDSACIYVAAPDPEEGPDWRAAVIECSGHVVNWPDVLDDRKLLVNRLTYPSHPQFNFGDYPPVARWEWDTEDSVQAYGFKCGSGWCLAGAKRPVVDMTEYGSTAEEIIHGYRDEQFLADSTHAVPSNGWPSGIWAVLVPHPRLRGVTKSGMKAAGGYPAGDAHVRGLDPTGNEHATRKYVAKYGFDPSAGTDTVNIFFADTSGVSIRRRAIEVKTRQMVYRNLGAGRPVPAVRWAWSLRDEDQWWPCPEGCCETIDGFQ